MSSPFPLLRLRFPARTTSSDVGFSHWLTPPGCVGFSNGCAIGCKACDGSSRGPIPWGQFKSDPFWDRKFNLCPIGAANSTQKSGTPTHTICDPKLRTVNTAVECGAADDWYQYSPVSAVVNVVASPSL